MTTSDDIRKRSLHVAGPEDTAGDPADDGEWLPKPEHCPAWCSAGHQADADAEGADWWYEQEHHGADLGGYVDERNQRDALGQPGWDMTLSARTTQAGDRAGAHVVVLRQYSRGELRLTSGETRQLAAQLLHMADRLDFNC